MLNIEKRENNTGFDFKLKHYKVGRASDTVIDLVPFTLCNQYATCCGFRAQSLNAITLAAALAALV